MRRLLVVPALVGPPVDLEAIAVRGAPDELPGPRRLGHRIRLGRESALDQGKVDEVSGKAVLLEDPPHHPGVLSGAGEPKLELLAAAVLEIVDVLVDAVREARVKAV